MDRTCGKCRDRLGNIWTTDGARCEECFCTVTMHSVKTVLSKHKLVAFRSNICVSTNPPSLSAAALAAVLNECLKPGGNRKASRMHFTAAVLHVVVPPDLYGSGETGQESMSRLAEKFGFEFHTSYLDEEVVHQLRGVRDTSDRNDLVRMAIRHQTMLLARSVESEVILLPTNATEAAINAMTQTVKGRGGGVPDEVSQSLVVGAIRFGRPFVELTARHITRYARITGVESFAVPSPHVAPPDSSLDELASDFIMRLQSNQPSTSTTVVRTAAKLTRRHDLDRCTLCGGRELDPEDVDESATRLCSACTAALQGDSTGKLVEHFEIEQAPHH